LSNGHHRLSFWAGQSVAVDADEPYRKLYGSEEDEDKTDTLQGNHNPTIRDQFTRYNAVGSRRLSFEDNILIPLLKITLKDPFDLEVGLMFA
jgi:hypothetical protein